MVRKSTDNSGKISSRIVLIYLLSSFFAGLIFAGLAHSAKKRGNLVIGWYLLSMICIGLFGIISYSLFATSSPTKDAFYYWLGISTLISNTIAVIILIKTLFTASND